jgi:hypothetical protein
MSTILTNSSWQRADLFGSRFEATFAHPTPEPLKRSRHVTACANDACPGLDSVSGICNAQAELQKLTIFYNLLHATETRYEYQASRHSGDGVD